MEIVKNKSGQKRLKILGEDEIKSIYERPHFTYEDRCHYFSLSQPEKDLLETFRSVKAKTYFILQLGYFKVKHQFFAFDLHEVDEDLQYILNEYFNNSELVDLSLVGKNTRLKQQQLIRELFNYRNCDAEEKQQLEEKANKAATFNKLLEIRFHVKDGELYSFNAFPGHSTRDLGNVVYLVPQ